MIDHYNPHPGTEVTYTWNPDPSTLNFSTLTTHTITVTADNLLSQPQTVSLVVQVSDPEFLVSDPVLESGVMLLKGGEVFVLTGAGVHVSCNVTGGMVTSFIGLVFSGYLIVSNSNSAVFINKADFLAVVINNGDSN